MSQTAWNNSNDSRTYNEISLPKELQQPVPRKIRLAAMGVYYLVGNVVLSVLFSALAIAILSDTVSVVRKGKELARNGILAYTGDVQPRGRATVEYSFTYNGNVYRGEALLPDRYSNKIEGYRKSGNFPVLFLPLDPSINHPSDWHDDESYSSPIISYILIAVVVCSWSYLGMFILRDWQLTRNGEVSIGRVTQCSRSINGGAQLRYEFRDTDGLLIEGRGEYPTSQKQESQVPVLYLPGESWKSRPYPLVFFRAIK